MTQLTQGLIQWALITFIGVNIIAGVLLLQKLTSGRLGFRFRDRVWSNLDDLQERVTIIEINMEMHKGEAWKDLGPVTERNARKDS